MTDWVLTYLESSLKIRITKNKDDINGQQYSSKPISVTRASTELTKELSGFAASYPPSPESGVDVAMPKKKGRKRKGKRSASAKKRNSEEIPRPVTPRSPSPVTPRSSSPVTIRSPSPDLAPFYAEPPQLRSPPADRIPATTPTVVEKPLSRRYSVNHQTPVTSPAILVEPQEPDETLEMKMSSVLERSKTQQELPARLQTNKTISNVGLVVEGDPVVDLTCDDDDESNGGNPFQVGQVVFAHLKGFPPWPAIIDVDPENENQCFQPPEGPPVLVHVVWLDIKQKAWVDIKNVGSFTEKNYANCARLGVKYVAALEKARIAQQLPLVDRRAQFGAKTLV